MVINRQQRVVVGAWKHRLRTKGWNYHVSPKGVNIIDDTNNKDFPLFRFYTNITGQFVKPVQHPLIYINRGPQLLTAHYCLAFRAGLIRIPLINFYTIAFILKSEINAGTQLRIFFMYLPANLHGLFTRVHNKQVPGENTHFYLGISPVFTDHDYNKNKNNNNGHC